eukprot:661681-Amphidinium_carterae.1
MDIVVPSHSDYAQGGARKSTECPHNRGSLQETGCTNVLYKEPQESFKAGNLSNCTRFMQQGRAFRHYSG